MLSRRSVSPVLKASIAWRGKLIEVHLRHRLLRQTGGFEGLVAMEKDPLACNQPVADTEHGREVADHLDAALAPRADGSVEAHDHTIAFEDALDGPTGLGPCLPHLRDPASERVIALEGPAELRYRCVDHHVLGVAVAD